MIIFDQKLNPANLPTFTALERDAHVAEWIRLADLQSAQDAPNETKREDGRGHRHESGVRKASRDLGIERDAPADGCQTFETFKMGYGIWSRTPMDRTRALRSSGGRIDALYNGAR